MKGSTKIMRDISGPTVSIDYIHYLVHMGKLHRVNSKLASVSVSTGCNFLIDIPRGIALHWSAEYFSKFGGLLEATRDPVVSAIGTEIKVSNCNTTMKPNLKSKFYHTATATANPNSSVFNIGIPGGTAVAGNGSSGSSSMRAELVLASGRWLIIIKPYADSADVILNALVYEE
jgi:hypothetical protein